MYYEKDGDEIYQFRVQADLITVPDNEILQVVLLAEQSWLQLTDFGFRKTW